MVKAFDYAVQKFPRNGFVSCNVFQAVVLAYKLSKSLYAMLMVQLLLRPSAESATAQEERLGTSINR